MTKQLLLNIVNKKTKTLYEIEKTMGGGGVSDLTFIYEMGVVKGGDIQNPYIYNIFLWTLASYSYLVIPYCPHFKYPLYYVIISNMAKQKLSIQAKAAKAKRDLAAAKTASHRKKKAENQRRRRAAIKAGKNVKGKDYDHKDRKFKSIKKNRGNDGKGTKRESGAKY